MVSGFRTAARIFALTLFGLGFGFSLPAFAQNFQESREQSSREFVVQKDRAFRDYRYALTFRLPLRSIGLYAPRGNFFSVQLEPADSQAFFIYHTSFRIRREAGVKALAARVYGPCKLPKIPEELEFRV